MSHTNQHAATVALPMAPVLDAIEREVRGCKACGLHECRTNTVFARGNIQASLMLVGEAPGENEDERGIPFCGLSGKLLDKALDKAGIPLSDVYICNVLKCRPPNNRTPHADEIAACRGFLDRQMHAVRPRAIIALGSVATKRLVPEATSFTLFRGTWQPAPWLSGPPVLPTYHPAYLLRQPAHRGVFLDDLRAAAFRVGLWDFEARATELQWAANVLAGDVPAHLIEAPGPLHSKALLFFTQDRGRCVVEALIWALSRAGIRVALTGVMDDLDVKVAWHYAGGFPYVLVTMHDIGCRVISPKAACGLLHVVLAEQDSAQALERFRTSLREVRAT